MTDAHGTFHMASFLNETVQITEMSSMHEISAFFSKVIRELQNVKTEKNFKTNYSSSLHW